MDSLLRRNNGITGTLPERLCPCESGKFYSACCEPYHNGLAAPTAEALMRSRYTAFVLSLDEYLLQTWHAKTRPVELNLAEDSATKWLGLQIKNTKKISEKSASVEFVARYKVAGKAERLHELSEFEWIAGRWYYLTGSDPR